MSSGRIVVFGGWGDLDLEDVFADVQTSEIRGNGVPGPWRTLGVRPPTGIYGHTTAETGIGSGHLLLLIGGQAGTGAYSNWVSVAYSDIAFERVGNFRIAPNGHLPAPRSGATVHLRGSGLILIGGSGSGGSYFDDVLVSSLDPGIPPK